MPLRQWQLQDEAGESVPLDFPLPLGLGEHL